MLTKDRVIEVLKTVEDPELMLDIWSLGLIYEIDIDKEKVMIKMTFTTPLCPYGPMLLEMIEAELKDKIKELKEVKLEVVFDPPWQPNDELRALLGA